LYAPSAVKRVEWIGKLQDAGFSLHDLQELLQGVNEHSGVASLAMERVRQVFADRLRETREQLQRLTTLERDLEASLAYLEGCRSCEPQAHQIQHCPSCDHNRHEAGAQPILVAGIHRG